MKRHHHKKIDSRFAIVTVIFVLVLGFLGWLGILWLVNLESNLSNEIDNNEEPTLVASIEIIDENSNATGGILSRRISEFVAQCEMDFFELGYNVVRAVIPADAAREIDLYIDGYSGYVKTVTDRGAGVTAEDFDRMVRYLQSIGKVDFTYIDVRTEGKGYYKD